jgi:hypothetical protein
VVSAEASVSTGVVLMLAGWGACALAVVLLFCWEEFRWRVDQKRAAELLARVAREHSYDGLRAQFIEIWLLPEVEPERELL